jgi:hypothetical protein
MARRGTLLALIRASVIDGHTAPLVPVGWEVVREAADWSTVYPLGREGSSVVGGQEREHRDVFFHARAMATVGAFTPPRVAFACVGHPWVLVRLADRIAADGLAWTRTWTKLADLRADATTAATAVKAAWRDERAEGDAGDVVRLLARIAGFEADDAEGA